MKRSAYRRVRLRGRGACATVLPLMLAIAGCADRPDMAENDAGAAAAGEPTSARATIGSRTAERPPSERPPPEFTARYLEGYWCAGTPTSSGGWQDSTLYEFRQDGSFRFAPAAYRFEFSDHVSRFEPLQEFVAAPGHRLEYVDQDEFRRASSSVDSVFVRGIGRCTSS